MEDAPAPAHEGAPALAAPVLDVVARLRQIGVGWRDASTMAYRLLFWALAASAGATVEAGDADADLAAVSPPVPARLPTAADLLPLLALTGTPSPEGDLPEALARVHESAWQDVDPAGRRSGGSFYTPQRLVDHLLDQTLEPALDEAADPAAVTVLDPTCGTGIFLVASAIRIARRGVPLGQAVSQVHGVDLDPGALELARTLLRLLAVVPGRPPPSPDLHLEVCDALHPGDPLGPARRAPYDVVVGNPPFRTRLRRRTAIDRAAAARLHVPADPVLRPYTDLSAVFLHRAVGWARPGGRVALVQPQSLLAARDAAGVRRDLAATCALVHLWACDRPLFDARVLTCAPVLRPQTPQGAVTRSHGPDFRRLQPSRAPGLDGEWSPLLAAALGVPEVTLTSDTGTLAGLAACTADFRDQYYGLAGAVHEAADLPGGVPLVTSGLIAPAACGWSQRPTRFLRRRWQAPVVDLAALAGSPLEPWARARLVTKVLVGTQGPVLKAVADEHAAWLGSVPTITVVPQPGMLWHALAVLLAPPVSAYAAARFAGTALSMRAIKLSARQVAALPLPADRPAWDRAAALVRAAQREPASRGDLLVEAGRLMCAAYGTSEAALDWWRDLLRA